MEKCNSKRLKDTMKILEEIRNVISNFQLNPSEENLHKIDLTTKKLINL